MRAGFDLYFSVTESGVKESQHTEFMEIRDKILTRKLKVSPLMPHTHTHTRPSHYKLKQVNDILFMMSGGRRWRLYITAEKVFIYLSVYKKAKQRLLGGKIIEIEFMDSTK